MQGEGWDLANLREVCSQLPRRMDSFQVREMHDAAEGEVISAALPDLEVSL